MTALVHVVADLAIAFVVFVGLSAIAGCMRSSQISRWEEREAERQRRTAWLAVIDARSRITTEPDPIESYAPPFVVEPIVWLHREGFLSIPLNPLGESHPKLRKLS